jgi:hypothetical protein
MLGLRRVIGHHPLRVIRAWAAAEAPMDQERKAHGHNQVVPYDRWPGALQKSPFFDE